MRTKTLILLVSLVFLHLIVIFAGFIASYGPSVQNRELPYAPPTRLHFVDASGFHLRPFVYASDTWGFQIERAPVPGGRTRAHLSLWR
jgi:hypothetical protein